MLTESRRGFIFADISITSKPFPGFLKEKHNSFSADALCLMDIVAFLFGTSIYCCIRNYIDSKSRITYPKLPMDMINKQFFPTVLQKKFWISIVECFSNSAVVNQESTMKHSGFIRSTIEYLRLSRTATKTDFQMPSPVLCLRIAFGLSHMLDKKTFESSISLTEWVKQYMGSSLEIQSKAIKSQANNAWNKGPHSPFYSRVVVRGGENSSSASNNLFPADLFANWGVCMSSDNLSGSSGTLTKLTTEGWLWVASKLSTSEESLTHLSNIAPQDPRTYLMCAKYVIAEGNDMDRARAFVKCGLFLATKSTDSKDKLVIEGLMSLNNSLTSNDFQKKETLPRVTPTMQRTTLETSSPILSSACLDGDSSTLLYQQDSMSSWPTILLDQSRQLREHASNSIKTHQMIESLQKQVESVDSQMKALTMQMQSNQCDLKLLLERVDRINAGVNNSSAPSHEAESTTVNVLKQLASNSDQLTTLLRLQMQHQTDQHTAAAQLQAFMLQQHQLQMQSKEDPALLKQLATNSDQVTALMRLQMQHQMDQHATTAQLQAMKLQQHHQQQQQLHMKEDLNMADQFNANNEQMNALVRLRMQQQQQNELHNTAARIQAMKLQQQHQQLQQAQLKEFPNIPANTPLTAPSTLAFNDMFKNKPNSWKCNGCQQMNDGNIAKCITCACPKQERQTLLQKPFTADVPSPNTAVPPPTISEMFKPKPGSWKCNVCNLQNDSAVNKCVACKSAKEEKLPALQKPQENITHVKSPQAPAPASNLQIKDMFKLKPGTWKCSVCEVPNEANANKCISCMSVKPERQPLLQRQPTVETPKATEKTPFKFGTPNKTISEMFKPKEGSWSCSACLLNNDGNIKKCAACDTIKPGEKTQDNQKENQQKSPQVSSNFSISKMAPLTNAGTTPVSKSSLFSFGSSNTTVSNTPSKPLFSFNQMSTQSPSALKLTSPKPPVESPAAAIKTSPAMTKQSTIQSDEDDQVEQVEDEKMFFKPVLDQLPELIEVKTGEEEDTVMFSEQAKLYRVKDNKFVERGIGLLKILHNNNSNKYRVVMRQDQTQKVCCNHYILEGMCLKPHQKGDISQCKAWMWWALDFCGMDDVLQEKESGTGVKETFAVKFSNVENSQEFHKVFKNALNKQQSHVPTTNQISKDKSPAFSEPEQTTDRDVVITKLDELKVTDEQKMRAEKFKLPINFYEFENLKTLPKGRVKEEMTEDELKKEDQLMEEAIKRYTNNTSISARSTSTPLTNSLFKLPEPQNVTSKPDQGTTASFSFSNSKIVSSGIDFTKLSGSGSEVSWLKQKDPADQSKNTWFNAGSQMFSNSPKAGADDSTVNDNSTAADDDDYDPQYEPIIELPKVTTKSGEEGNAVFFLKHCKCYIFTDKQWKERGVGELKVLVEPETPVEDNMDEREVWPAEKDAALGKIKRIRLVMRRDQILKLCMNQVITDNKPSFKFLQGQKSRIMWTGTDFIDNELSTSNLCVKFKTISDCEEFQNALDRAYALK